MQRQWKGSRVTGRWLDIGLWSVLSAEPGTAGWCELKPENETAQRLASMGRDGVVWIRKRELTRQPDQEETLL